MVYILSELCVFDYVNNYQDVILNNMTSSYFRPQSFIKKMIYYLLKNLQDNHIHEKFINYTKDHIADTILNNLDMDIDKLYIELTKVIKSGFLSEEEIKKILMFDTNNIRKQNKLLMIGSKKDKYNIRPYETYYTNIEGNKQYRTSLELKEKYKNFMQVGLLTFKNKDIVIINVHNTEQASKDKIHEKLKTLVNDLIVEYDNIIIGDFNKRVKENVQPHKDLVFQLDKLRLSTLTLDFNYDNIEKRCETKKYLQLEAFYFLNDFNIVLQETPCDLLNKTSSHNIIKFKITTSNIDKDIVIEREKIRKRLSDFIPIIDKKIDKYSKKVQKNLRITILKGSKKILKN